jgi:hypothetical protein
MRKMLLKQESQDMLKQKTETLGLSIKVNQGKIIMNETEENSALIAKVNVCIENFPSEEVAMLFMEVKNPDC